MVEYPVDNHPLRFNAVAVEALLHHGVLGVFALPLLAVELLLPGAVVVRRRLVHVVLALVVPIHDGVIQLQLREQQNSQKKQKKTISAAKFHSAPPLSTTFTSTRLGTYNPSEVLGLM